MRGGVPLPPWTLGRCRCRDGMAVGVGGGGQVGWRLLSGAWPSLRLFQCKSHPMACEVVGLAGLGWTSTKRSGGPGSISGCKALQGVAEGCFGGCWYTGGSKTIEQVF